MEQLFNYETAKQTLVMTAYMMLIVLDCYWVGYLIISGIKWCFKKVKAIISIIKKHNSKSDEEEFDEQ